VSYSYEEATNTLTVKVSGETVDARLRVFSSDETYFDEYILGGGEIIRAIPLPKGVFSMTVDDFVEKRQQLFELNLASAPVPSGQPTTCSASVCSPGESCVGSSYASPEGVCCTGSCIQTVEPTTNLKLFNIPFVLWAALILLVIAVLVLFGVMKSPKKIAAPKKAAKPTPKKEAKAKKVKKK
jgi:hypothetical protein